jgi:hypothetical protein
MRSSVALALAAALLLPAGGLRTEEKDEVLEAQRKAVAENWDKVGAGPSATHETEHFIVAVPKAMDKRLKEIGTLLEKSYDTAHKVLYLPKELAYPGKLTVYLFAQPEQLDAFIRRVEKRRLRGAEKGSFSVDDTRLHVAAAPPREMGDPPVEVQAAQQVASALLMRKAGVRTIVPGWLVQGFGRATYYRLAPLNPAVAKDRKTARTYAVKNKRGAPDVWGGTLEGEEYTVLAASVADFLAHGPGKSKFAAVVEGFRPEENVQSKTVEQALTTAKLKVDTIDKRWRTWVLNPR